MNKDETLMDQLVPDFSITTTNPALTKLSDITTKNIVLFFYPKDNTPVCSSEAKSFRDSFELFVPTDTAIFGISRDSIPSHLKFQTRLELPFDLIADTHSELCNFFRVISEKNFFGKKITGIVRSTFLLDHERKIKGIWRKVRVGNHINEVLSALNKLQETH